MLLEGKEESLLLCAIVVGSLDTWACSCSEGLNVRYLSANEQDMLIMELLAAKDAAGVPSPEVMDRTSEDGEEDVPEDF